MFFICLFVLYWKAPDYIGTNTAVRFDLAKAIVFDHSLAIDRFWRNTGDWATRDGHFYADKAPGSGLLVTPFYFAFVKVEEALGRDPLLRENDVNNIRRSDLFVTALPSVILSFLLLTYLLGKAKALDVAADQRQKLAWIVVFTYAVATIAFPYSTILWGHQTAGAFLFFAFYALVKRKNPAWAGLFFSVAVLTEYTAVLAFPAFAILLYAYAEGGTLRDRVTRFARFCAGGLPGLVIFLAYHKICFGGFLAMPTEPRFLNPEHIPLDDAAHQLFGVFRLPTWGAFYGILFSPGKGLFFLSPVLLFSVYGFYRWFKQPGERVEAAAMLWIVVASVLTNSAFDAWQGGWCAGPRYLTSMVPFLAAAMLWARPRGWLFYGLLAVSTVNIVSIVAVDINTPMLSNTLTEKIYPDLLSKSHLWPMFAFMSLVVLVLFTLARVEEA